jgi:hypothetical protein
VKTSIAKTLNLSYQSRSHSKVDTSSLVKKIEHHVTRELLNVHTANRLGNDTQKPVVDILSAGMAKLQSSTLNVFYKKVYAMVQARRAGAEVASEEAQGEDEEDTLPSNPLVVNDEAAPGDNADSVLVGQRDEF